ncbi:MAG: protein kinase domain-containing protein [Pontiellaceae bacterium]
MKKSDPSKKQIPPNKREILNPNLFSKEISFSNTEQILFQEDLHQTSTTSTESLTDSTADTRYIPINKIKDGGMKTIWEVKDTRTQRILAMALIQPERIASQEDIEAFLHEARLTAHLQHPNILPVYDIALEKNGNPYFTMKLLRGETLEAILHRLQQNDPDTEQNYTLTHLLNIFLNLCDAVDYAHTKGVLHLDIKPANVMIGNFGEVHLLDWGLATLLTESNQTDLTSRKIVGGTPGYMAPEQALGNKEDLHFHTDIYMLCALLYQILTRTPPHVGETTEAIMRHSTQGTIIPPAQQNNHYPIPKALSAIAMKGLAVHPAERYANVAALKNDIRNYLNGYATLAENPTLITHLKLLINRHRIAFALLITAIALISLTIFFSFRSIQTSEQVAINALDQLQQKQDYIEETALNVAPDYLELARQHEYQYRYTQADKALTTALTFNPLHPESRLLQAYIHLSHFEFQQAYHLLNQSDGIPTTPNLPALRLANKYKNSPPITDIQLPTLIQAFIQHNLTHLLPRLFHHLNQAPFNPETRFNALEQCLQKLNPDTPNLTLYYTPFGSAGFLIDLSQNPELNSLTPLSGLPIIILNLNGTGLPDLAPLQLDALRELRLADTRFESLNQIGDLPQLNILDLSHTRIRNISSILRYPNLTTLQLNGIENLELSPRLIWCRQLKTITLTPQTQTPQALQPLINRGILLIYKTGTP